uniref:NACHT, LRR and PYD domains-containing protein 3-like n=1 Tax=Scleropages formosus TaxID=113540 RepID=A0A8C9QZN4_SCLFO
MEVENRGIHFLETHRAELIQSVSDVMPIADKMMSRKLIHKEAYEKIRAARTSQEKMRDVYDALRPGGDEVKAELYRILREECPLIIQKLSSPSSCSAREVDTARKKYINHIKSDCAVVKEYNSLIGERVWLDDRYMDLLLIQQHRKENERTEELRSKGNTLQQVLSKRDSKDFRNTRIECLFDSVPHGVTSKTVVLQGQAGIGKSFTTLKMMSDWASGKLYSDRFSYVFLLRCQELNLIAHKVSLHDLILYCCQDLEPVIPQILSQPEKVLFIVDGFDELKLSEEALKDFTTDPYEKMSVEQIMNSILRKKVLQNSCLAITTRPISIKILEKILKNPAYTEILGFSENRIKEYIQKFFKDEKKVERAFCYVKEHEGVLTACFVPVMCWIVCTVLREHFQEGTDISHILETETSIFVYFVSIILKHHCQESSLPPQDLLQRLSILAKSGIDKNEVLLKEEEVNSFFSDSAQVPSSFLNKILLKKSIGCKTVYSFMHLTFQEFFDALSYILCDEKDAKENMETLLKKHTFPDAKENMESFLKHKFFFLFTGSVSPFLFGLLNTNTLQFLKEEMTISIPSGVKPLLLDWLQSFISSIQNFCSSEESDFFFRCLYELHDPQFLCDVMQNVESMQLSFKTTVSPVFYCLRGCERLKSLDLYSCKFTEKVLEMLQPVVMKCEVLILDTRNIRDGGARVLSTVLKSHNCKIQNLSLLNSGLTDSSIDELCCGLQKLTCLTRFCLGAKRLSDDKLGTLLSTLSTQKDLSVVKLSVKEITEKTASSLTCFILQCYSLQEVLEDCMSAITWDLSITLTRPDVPEKEVKFKQEFTTYREADLLCQAFRNEGLIVKTCSLTMRNGKDLIPTVTLQHMVTELKLTWCMGTEKLVSAVTSFLQGCHRLQHLEFDPWCSEDDTDSVLLDDGDVYDQYLMKLLPTLTSARLLSGLSLNWECVTQTRATILREFYLRCPGLKIIHLNTFNRMYGRYLFLAEIHLQGESSPENVLHILFWSPQTSSLNSFCDIMEEAGFSFRNSGLVFLELDCKDIDGLNCELKVHHFIRAFVCEKSKLTDGTVHHLSSFLQKCCNLVTFRLFDCCSLSDEGLQGLLSPLRLMAFLKEVEIPVSCLTAPLALGFVSFLQSCDHLKLQLNCDWLKEEGIRVFHEYPGRPDCEGTVAGANCDWLIEEGSAVHPDSQGSSGWKVSHETGFIRALGSYFKKSDWKVTITGWRCNKETNHCTEEGQRELSCNSYITMKFREDPQIQPEQQQREEFLHEPLLKQKMEHE